MKSPRRTPRPAPPRRPPLSHGPRSSTEPRDHELPDVLDAIERAAGPRVRRLAERATVLEREAFVRKQGHELIKFASALSNLASDLRKLDAGSPEAPSLATCAAQLDEDRAYFTRYLVRARAAVLLSRTHHAEELLAPLVEEARERVVAELDGGVTSVSFAVEIEEGLTLHADHPALVEAIEEIARNAVEAYEVAAPVQVRIRARSVGSKVEIVIADRGCGFHEEDVPWAFVPFSGAAKPRGTGLGLFLARRAVEEVHGGSLAIESTRGHGTEVRIVLPRKQRDVRPRRRLTEEEMFHEAARKEREAAANAAR
jgi:signal transduction histidine kinase